MLSSIRIKEIINALNTTREILTDTQALEVPTLFPNWREGVEYKINDKIIFNDTLYKVINAHTSQSDWTPDISPSLFAKVLITDSNVISEWEQPDSTNPYMSNDKVLHNGSIWISTIDNNVWEPGVYGWNIAND